MFLLRGEGTTITQVTKNVTGEQQSTITTKLFWTVEYIRYEGFISAFFYHYVMFRSPCPQPCVQTFHAKERSSDIYKEDPTPLTKPIYTCTIYRHIHNLPI